MSFNSTFIIGLLICAGLLISVSVNAQEKSFKSGFFAGLNTSQITGDNLSGYNQPGFTAGIFVSRKLGKNAALTMEMGYLPKGARKNLSPRDSIPTLYFLRLHYIEIPIMFQYMIRPKIQLEAGISTGVLLGHYEEDINGELTGSYAPVEQFKRFDISFDPGVSYFFNEKWSFNLRNANSIFPVRDHDQGSTFRLNRGQYTSCIMGRFVYRF